MEAKLQDKMRFIGRGIEHKCQPHQQLATLMCAKVDCQQHPFLCQQCLAQRQHPHQQQLLSPVAWLQQMAQLIANTPPPRVKIFQPQYDPAPTNHYLQQLNRTLRLLQQLQELLLDSIQQSKAKVIDCIRKCEESSSSRLESLFRLYANPYLLANKVSSQPNDHFIQEVKRLLRGDTQPPVDPFNPKYELITLHRTLNSLLAQQHQLIFPEQPSPTSPPQAHPQLEIVPHGSLDLESLPEKVFAKGETLVVCYKGSTNLLLGWSKLPEEKVGVSLSQCSLLSSQGGVHFIGVSKESPRELITYIGFRLGSFTFPFAIASLLLYFQKGRFYAILGRDQGKLSVFDIELSQILATLQQGHNLKVRFIEPWPLNSRVVSCGENSPLSLYSLRSDSSEIELHFEQELSLKVGKIQQVAVKGNFAVILSEQRTVLVIDLVLRAQYRTSFAEVCRPFDFVSILGEKEGGLNMVTHNKGESCVCVWWLERGRQSIGMERVGVPLEEGQEGRVVEMRGGELWVMYPHRGTPRINNFNLLLTT